MKRGFVVLIAALVASLGLADVGQAQPPASVHVQGTIRAVDCGAQTVTLDTGAGTGVYRPAGGATFYINGAGASLCALQQFVGAPATAWLTAYGNDLVITRVDVAAQGYAPPSAPAPAPAPYPAPPAYTPPATYPYTPPATYPYTPPATYPYTPPATYPYTPPATYPYTPPATYPAPYPYPAPYYGPYNGPYYGPNYPSLTGVVLGTIFLAGLTYLLVRAASGALYRYPYYGPYYNYYYRPYYRPYFGPLIYRPAFVYGPYRYCPFNRGWGYWCR